MDRYCERTIRTTLELPDNRNWQIPLQFCQLQVPFLLRYGISKQTYSRSSDLNAIYFSLELHEGEDLCKNNKIILLNANNWSRQALWVESDASWIKRICFLACTIPKLWKKFFFESNWFYLIYFSYFFRGFRR